MTTKAAGKVAIVVTSLAMATSMLSLAPLAHAETCSVGMTDLTVGSTGAAVECLQKTLVAAGHLVMPAGVNYGYFGSLTQSAVAKWQTAKGIMPAAGYFGPKSRAAFTGVAGGSTSCATPFDPLTGKPCTTGGTTTPNAGGPLEGGAGTVDSYTLLSTLNNEEVGEDEEDVEVAGLEVEVDEGSDIEITAVKLVFDEGTAGSDFEDYATEVSVWLDGEEVGRADADKFNDDNNWTSTISLDGAIIRADETADLTVAVSGISNLDSGDAQDTWTVDFRQVRFVDADGATVSEDPGTAARTFSFEAFATAADAEFKIQEDDTNINDARTIEVDATDDTDGVEVLSFTMEAEGDSDLEIKNYAVSVTVTGAANTDDVLAGLSLWIDGEEVATADTVSSGGSTEDYIFDDVDYVLEAGDEVEAVIKADFLSIADALDEGDTIAFAINEDIDHITTRIQVEDEAGENLADADLTGSVTSGAFELRSVGIMVTLVSVDEETLVDDGSDDDTGIFTIKVNVEAFGGTVYVASSSQATTANTIAGASILENLYRLDKGSTATTTLVDDLVDYSTSGGAALTSSVGNIALTEDEDTDLTFTITRTNTGGADNNGIFRAFLKAIGWSTSDAYGAYNIYNFNLEDYKTGTASLD